MSANSEAPAAQPDFSAVYVSTKLTTLHLPQSPAWGDWVQLPHLSQLWYHRLDDQAFLWLRSSVQRAIQSGLLQPDDAATAQERLRFIHAMGRRSGQLTASTDNPFTEPLPGWRWETGLPDLQDYDFSQKR